MKWKRITAAAVAACSTCLPVLPAAADAPQLGRIMKRAEQLDSLHISELEELRLGEAVSEKVRLRYGVVQNAAVHRYVALVGLALARASSRPNLPWTFIVLDTDGVNAFAAPGGYIHVTRGALGLVANEAELAAVLAHEIIHVANKHAVDAIRKGNALGITASETHLENKQVFSRLVDQAADIVMAGFGRAEEIESDTHGVRLVNKVGYSPGGLGAFLTRLSERNKGATAKQGLFASHPEMKERLDRLARQIGNERLDGIATLEDRYRQFVSYRPVAQSEIAVVPEGSAGLTGSGAKTEEKPAEKPAEPKKKGFGLANLLKPTGSEKKSAEVTGSGASRGVDTERNARGGPVPTRVAVNVTPADVAAFKSEGKLR